MCPCEGLSPTGCHLWRESLFAIRLYSGEPSNCWFRWNEPLLGPQTTIEWIQKTSLAVKLPLGTAASYGEMLNFPGSLLLMPPSCCCAPGTQWVAPEVAETWMSSWLPVSEWPSPGHCRHWGKESAEGSSLSLCLLNKFLKSNCFLLLSWLQFKSLC